MLSPLRDRPRERLGRGGDASLDAGSALEFWRERRRVERRGGGWRGWGWGWRGVGRVVEDVGFLGWEGGLGLGVGVGSSSSSSSSAPEERSIMVFSEVMEGGLGLGLLCTGGVW